MREGSPDFSRRGDAETAREPNESRGAAVGLALLAVCGHAASLRLIDVVPYGVFQHFRTWQWLAENPDLASLVVAFQTVVVGLLSWRGRKQLGLVLAGLMGPGGVLALLALTAFSLAIPTESASRFAGEIVFAGGVALVSALNLLLAALSVPAPDLARAQAFFADRLSLPGQGDVRARSWDRSLPLWVALWVVAASALWSVFVLERVPHIDDSISNLFQAKYFSMGRLYLPAPPDPAAFPADQVIANSTKWYGYAFPGWPLVLALGVKLRLPWLVNPLLGCALVLLTHAAMRRRTDRGMANLTVLLLGVSPWLIFVSAEFMAHPLTAVLTMLAVFAFERASARATGWGGWSLLAGIAAGALVLTRAIDAVVAVVAIGITALCDRRFIHSLIPAAIAGAAAVSLAALSLPYNAAVTGDATYPPHMAWSDSRWGPGVDRLGFGPGIGIREWKNLDPLPGHGVADVVLNLNKNFFLVSTDLFGWAFGSAFFVWLSFGFARFRAKDGFLLALPLCFAIGYSAYWFSGGPDLGARYWYPALVAWVALSARGMAQLAGILRKRALVTQAAARVGTFVAIASLSALATVMPWRAATKYYRYRGIGGEVREIVSRAGIEGGLVFVRGLRDYKSAFPLNPVTLDEPSTIFAFDAGPKSREAVRAHFPGRRVWVIGRQETGVADSLPPLAVLAGPFEPAVPIPR